MVRMARGHAMLNFFQQQAVAQRGTDLRLVDDLRQFGRAQQRHGGHHDQAGLNGGQKAGRHHGAVTPAQEQAVARHQAHVACEHQGDAVDLILQLRIGPGERLGRALACHQAVHAMQGDALAPTFAHMAIEQFDRAID